MGYAARHMRVCLVLPEHLADTQRGGAGRGGAGQGSVQHPPVEGASPRALTSALPQMRADLTERVAAMQGRVDGVAAGMCASIIAFRVPIIAYRFSIIACRLRIAYCVLRIAHRVLCIAS